MKKIGLIVALVLVAGCSGSAHKAAPKPTTTTTTIPPLDTPHVWIALPQPLELPVGWTAQGQPSTTAFDPQTGPGKGNCGGPNADARAQTAGALAVANSETYKVPQPGGGGTVRIYAFPTPDAAKAFMQATRDSASKCPQGLDFQQAETEVDLFADASSDSATWNVHETVGFGSAGDVAADEAFIMTSTQNYSTDRSSTSYRATFTDEELAERYGDVVLLFDVNGSSGLVGFANSDETPPFVPGPLDVLGAAQTMGPTILKKLGPRPGVRRASVSSTTSSTPTTRA